MIVAIDGPAGSGKSTVSRTIAEQTGFLYLNSGRYYRAITWKAIDLGIDVEDAERLEALSSEIVIEVSPGSFLVDGIPREQELHASEIDRATAIVSRVPGVRREVNRRLIAVAANRDVVVEGRDMSTVVFPGAEVKVYLDADVRSRARRRRREHGEKASLEAVERAIRERDEIDRTKSHGALTRAADAVYVDTTHLTLDQVCEKVIAIIQKKNQSQSGAIT